MVLAGSSNFGYKSLVTSSDHEVNFLAKSKEFTEKTLEVCEWDRKHSERVKHPEAISLREMGQAGFHRLMAPLIG